MGDAVLGMVCEERRAAPPTSPSATCRIPRSTEGDPQEEQTEIAAQIYKGYGRWSTVCSAIVCWAFIAA